MSTSVISEVTRPQTPHISSNQAETNQSPGKLVDIMPVALLAQADRDDDDQHPVPIHTIDDAVPLADGANTSITNEFTPERLTLLLRVMRQSINSLADVLPDSTVSNPLESRERFWSEGEMVGHSPSFRLA